MSIEIAKRAWESAMNAGTRASRIARAAKTSEYFNYLASRADADNMPDKPDAFAELLLRDYHLAGAMSVLDVGCGMGGATLTFAEAVKSVTAIDMCSEVLNAAVRRAERAGRSNISFSQTLWEDFTAEKPFELVYSAMCGGICSLDELLRFESYSKNACAIVTIGKTAASGARKALREAITPRPLPGLLQDGALLFNLLHELDRRPNVVQTRARGVMKLTAEEAIRRFEIYYGAYGYDDELSRRRLREHIERVSVDGYWIEENDVTTMLIHWRTPERGV
ncbi:MAG: methyltransferase domain-containing protein [Oscillospiraceae bacterium]|jgi:SAM-dependent methyltransferase|nr:methyltransferase domain-containing protein [Oscillospiraceae bacterium]